MSIKLKRGFSLIEILVSVAIIAILAGITMINFKEPQDKAKLTKTKSDWAVMEGKYIEKLIGKWSFDEGSGTTAIDSTDFKNNGTLYNSPTWKDSKSCVSEQCLEFNGTNQYVATSSAPVNLISGAKAKSISAWIYPNNLSPGGIVVGINQASGSNQSFNVGIMTSSGNTYVFFDDYNVNNSIAISGTEIPALSTWSHIVFAFDGTNWKYYLNGSLIKSGTFATTINTVPNIITIGRRMSGSPTTFFWSGMIDEPAVYSEAVTFAQVKSDYVAGLNQLLEKNEISQADYNSRISALGKNNLAEK
jgi:prepilin-type N-terminal cleavage/methylation domain-containing protein